MGGCIRDNTDHCNNVIVNFSYTADDGQEHLTEYIGSIDLYVFDEEGTHIMTVGYGGTDLHSSGGSAFFRLQEGRYALYAVGNPLEKTLVFGLNTGDPERMFIASPESARGGTVHGQDHNYLGSASLEISDSRYTSRSTVRMYSAHIDVSVEVTGLHARLGTRAAGDYTLSISESNSKVDFNNRVAYGELHECYPEMEYDAETGTYLWVRLGTGNYSPTTFGTSIPEVVKAEEKAHLDVPDLLALFEKGAGEVSDEMLLS